MPAIWQTWPRYSSTLSRCSARFIGSRKSTRPLNAIRLSFSVDLGRTSKRGSITHAGQCEVVLRDCRLVGRVGLGLARVDDGSEARDGLAVLQPHDDHALGRASEALDLV